MSPPQARQTAPEQSGQPSPRPVETHDTRHTEGQPRSHSPLESQTRHSDMPNLQQAAEGTDEGTAEALLLKLWARQAELQRVRSAVEAPVADAGYTPDLTFGLLSSTNNPLVKTGRRRSAGQGQGTGSGKWTSVESIAPSPFISPVMPAAPVGSRRTRRASFTLGYQDGKSEEETLAHHLGLRAVPSTASAVPVGSARTRRASYTLGCPAGFLPPDLEALAASGMPVDYLESDLNPQPLFSSLFAQASAPKGFEQLSSRGSGVQATHGSLAPMVLTRGGTSSHTPSMCPTSPAGDSSPHGRQSSLASPQPSSTAAASMEADGLAARLRRLMQRTKSRSNLGRGLGDTHPARVTTSNSQVMLNSSSRHSQRVAGRSHDGSSTGDEGSRHGTRKSAGGAGDGVAMSEINPADSSATWQPGEEAKKNKNANNFVRPLVTLSPFVPRLLMDEISAQDAKYRAFDQGAMRDLAVASKGLQPSMYEFQGAVMIADVKGFTQLTEILSKKGTAGVELLTNCMNNYFTRVINMILAFDGDVVKFAGDSMIVVFSPTNEETVNDPVGGGVYPATLRCAQCAHVLATRLGHMRMKMNGQVEPINVGADNVDAEDPNEDNDLLRRQAGVAVASTIPAVSARKRTMPPLALSSPIVQHRSTQDLRSLQVIQHAKQQVASMNATLGGGSNTGTGLGDALGSLSVGRASGGTRNSERVSAYSSAHGSVSGNMPLVIHMGEDIAVAGQWHDGGQSLEAQAGVNAAMTDEVKAAPLGSAGASEISAGDRQIGSASSQSRSKRSWISNILLKRGSGVMKRPGGEQSSGNSVTSQSQTSGGTTPMGSNGGGTSGRRRVRSEAFGARSGDSGARALLSPANAPGDAAALWGVEGLGGAVQMSLASRLNMPPPVRQLGPGTQSRAASAAFGAFAGALPPGLYANETHSFTLGADGTAMSASARRSTGTFPSMGSPNASASLGPASWASKFQVLQSGVTGAVEPAMLAERSNASLGSRLAPPAWETLPEGDETSEARPVEIDQAQYARSHSPSPAPSISGGSGVTPSNPSATSKSRIADMRRRMFGRPGSTSVTHRPSNASGTQFTIPDALVPVSDDTPRPEGVIPVGPKASNIEWSEDSYTTETFSNEFPPAQRRLGNSRGTIPWSASIEGYMAPSSLSSAAGEVLPAVPGMELPGPIAEAVLFPVSTNPSANNAPHISALHLAGPTPLPNISSPATCVAASCCSGRELQGSQLHYVRLGSPSAQLLLPPGPAALFTSQLNTARSSHAQAAGTLPGVPLLETPPQHHGRHAVSTIRRTASSSAPSVVSTTAPPPVASTPDVSAEQQQPMERWVNLVARQILDSPPFSAPLLVQHAYQLVLCPHAYCQTNSDSPGTASSGPRQEGGGMEAARQVPAVQASTPPIWQCMGPGASATAVAVAEGSGGGSSVSGSPHDAWGAAAVVEGVGVGSGSSHQTGSPISSKPPFGTAKQRSQMESGRGVMGRMKTWLNHRRVEGAGDGGRSSGPDNGTDMHDDSTTSGEASGAMQPSFINARDPGMGRMQTNTGPYGHGKARDPVMEEVQNSEFSLKIMISAGSVCVFQVGGNIDEVTDPMKPDVPRWEFFIGDRPLAPLRDQHCRRRCIAQLAVIEDHAGAGQVVGSREVMDLLLMDWVVDMLPDDVGLMVGPTQAFQAPVKGAGPVLRQMHKQLSISTDLQPEGSLLVEIDPISGLARKGTAMNPRGSVTFDAVTNALAGVVQATGDEDTLPTGHQFAQLPPNVQRRLASLLRMSVLGSVRSKIEAGHLDFINEIRPLTCLFLGFPSLLDEKEGVPESEQVDAVQYCLSQVQSVMRKWDGSLLQFRCDEKGFVGICAFGLPGHTHEDNPSRGVLAALELQKCIEEKQHRVCIGVTTGDLLCTCVGARKIRSEYTVFGDAINLSARLMVKCKSGLAEILCDEPTHGYAKSKAKFEELEPLPVKGKKLPVYVFRVSCLDDTNQAILPSPNPGPGNSREGRAAAAPERPLVGRDTETSFILNRAANMIAGMATGGAIVIEGNTGMGKTKLLTEVRRSLERIYHDTSTSSQPAFHLFFGVADIANKSSKLHPWRRMFQELLMVDQARCQLPKGTSGSGATTTGVPSGIIAYGSEGRIIPTSSTPLPARDSHDILIPTTSSPQLFTNTSPAPTTANMPPTLLPPVDLTVPAAPLSPVISSVGSGQLPSPSASEHLLTLGNPGLVIGAVGSPPQSGLPGVSEVGVASGGIDTVQASRYTALGQRLVACIPSYNTDWSWHLAELLDLPQSLIPLGAEEDGSSPASIPLVTAFNNRTASAGGQHNAAVMFPPLVGFGSVAGPGLSGTGFGSIVPVVASGRATEDSLESSARKNVGTMSSRVVGASGVSGTGGLGLPGRGPGGSFGAGVRGGVAALRAAESSDSHGGSLTVGLDEELPKLAISLNGGLPTGSFGNMLGNLLRQPPSSPATTDFHRRTLPRRQSNTGTESPGTPGTPGTAMSGVQSGGSMVERALAGARAGVSSLVQGRSMLLGQTGVSSNGAPSLAAGIGSGGFTERPTAERGTVSHTSAGGRGPGSMSQRLSGHARNMSVRFSPSAGSTTVMGGGGGMSPPSVSGVTGGLKKNSLNFLVHVLREFTALYGPIILLLENLHEFDTWSWQLLVKVAEVLSPTVLVLSTTRPNDLPANNGHQMHGKAALHQKVAMLYRHLLKLPTTSRVQLEPFTFLQTKALMQVVADINYPDQYVLAVLEKTGGMPLYIEKVTEFLCQKPWLESEGGEFAANVNKMIRNLNFQQVIIERMDRLKPGIHLSLKVASVMGQWVDLDILHKFHPMNKSREELQNHLLELQRGNFLKPTDTEGVWEFNMVERDIVYEVIPHYQRRRLHAKLAQELERSLEEHHVATLTTIAYHWNQACMGHEVTEVECALKAIEYWQRAAEAAYSGSSLMEALRLYQKAAQIAELLGESMGESFHARAGQGDRPSGASMTDDASGAPPLPGTDSVTGDEGNASFTAVGGAYRGQLNWSLISRITRAQWEKSMASCCLGIVMQHRLEYNNQMEYWDTEDYFTLLTEHAIRGLMLLGAPHPRMVLTRHGRTNKLASLLFSCCWAGQDELAGWQAGVVLQDQEVTEIRDILLVLVIAAEHYSLQHDGEEYVRLLTFCKRVCLFFNKCSDTGLDPFMDIHAATHARIKAFKSSRGATTTHDFDVGGTHGQAVTELGSLVAGSGVIMPGGIGTMDNGLGGGVPGAMLAGQWRIADAVSQGRASPLFG